MSSYQKFTLKTIQTNLKSGKYADATGANRAIGKTQELSAADKEKAKALVAKHFGVMAKPKATKVAKKAAAKPVKAAKTVKVAKAAKKSVKKVAKKVAAKSVEKPATKKVSKKTSKKVTKAAPVARIVTPVAKGRGKKPAAVKSAAPKRAARTKAVPEPEAAPISALTRDASTIPTALKKVQRLAATHGAGDNELILNIGKIIETINMALKAMDVAKSLYPKGSYDAGVNAAQSAMTKAVQALDTKILSKFDKGGPAAVSASKKPSAVASAPAAKMSPKKVQKPKGPVAVVAESDELEDQLEEELQIDQDLLDRDDLDDDERYNVMLARKHRPAVDAMVAARGNGTPDA